VWQELDVKMENEVTVNPGSEPKHFNCREKNGIKAVHQN